MPYHRIADAGRLHTVIESILIIEVDADLATLLTTIVEQAVHLSNAQYGALGVLSADGDALSEFITVGLSEEQRMAIGTLPVGRGLLGEVIDSGEPLRLASIASAERSAGFPNGHPPMETFLGVPVRLEGGEVFGNLYLCDRVDGQPFTDEDEALVDTLGRAAGLIIERARLRRIANEASLAQAQRIARLSPQERNILDRIAEGKTNRQIAEEMFLSEKTVKNYVSNLLAKLGFSRRTEAAVFAARLEQERHS